MELDIFTDAYFMQEALKEAQTAFDREEVPIGAVVVFGDRIIARAHNLTETLNDVTAHAEMQAITAAANHLGAKYLDECSLYVTIEPCAMCAGALFWTQLSRVVFGAYDPKRGASRVQPSLYHPKTIIEAGLMEQECTALLQSFFKNKRT